MNDIHIIDATPDDADMIADAIFMAIGEELVAALAGDCSREDVHKLFSGLARRDDSQYSYLNSRIAVLPDGTKAGVCISYNGGLLKSLRKPFFEEANRILGWNMSDEEMEKVPYETGPEEFYLDSLATLPDYRGRGIATLLIDDAHKKALKSGLPLGLLVADDNPEARKLYESLGFNSVGRRLFAGAEMTNLRMSLPE